MKPPCRADAVHDGGHAELAHAVVDGCRGASGVRDFGAGPHGQAGRREIRGAAHEFRQQLGEGFQEFWDALRVAILAPLACRVSMILADSAAQLAGSSPVVRRLNSAARAG